MADTQRIRGDKLVLGMISVLRTLVFEWPAPDAGFLDADTVSFLTDDERNDILNDIKVSFVPLIFRSA
jgi:hypothetical protein